MAAENWSANQQMYNSVNVPEIDVSAYSVSQRS